MIFQTFFSEFCQKWNIKSILTMEKFICAVRRYVREDSIWHSETESIRTLYLQINGKLIVLVEHQSTVNENMPFRCLEYVTRIFEEIVPLKTRYAEKVFKIPNPDFYVVYVGKKELPKEQELRLSDAFYEKDGSKLELVVKLKNCSDSTMLPISGRCDILKEYCQFIEIVERMYNKTFPKKSFKKAIETAISQGILADYLDRKSREVINMLCAKYDYKMDIAVKQEEAFQDGIEKGAQQKAVEAAKKFIKMHVLSEEQIAQGTGLPIEIIKNLSRELNEKNNTIA